jgi:ABC-2 type transport system ATP-binding protein
MGKTVVISSHILAELEEICTGVAIMEAGRLLASGSPRQIRQGLAHVRTIRVRLAEGEEQTHLVTTEEEQQALLRRLVAEEGLPVVEFTETGAGLEDVFMRVTKGIVQ